jgi:dsRNA-specific ribonuclease
MRARPLQTAGSCWGLGPFSLLEGGEAGGGRRSRRELLAAGTFRIYIGGVFLVGDQIDNLVKN